MTTCEATPHRSARTRVRASRLRDEQCEDERDEEGAASAMGDPPRPWDARERGDHVLGKHEIDAVEIRDGGPDHTGEAEWWRDPRRATATGQRLVHQSGRRGPSLSADRPDTGR